MPRPPHLLLLCLALAPRAAPAQQPPVPGDASVATGAASGDPVSLRPGAAFEMPGRDSRRFPLGPAQAAAPTRLPAAEIQAEMRSGHATAYTLVGLLAGGFVGGLVGGRIGYSIGYARDIRRGCEDCGLGGLLTGALIGGTAGLLGGGFLGAKVGERADREAAIQRILVRRELPDTVRNSPD